MQSDARTLQGLMSGQGATIEELWLHRQQLEVIDAEITRRQTQAHKTIPNWVVVAGLLIASGIFYAIVQHFSYQAATPQDRHQIDIERVFSGSVGSVPSVVEYIKTNMNDPSSFEHVKTTYREEDGHLFVVMTYRGKNGFNATITKTIGARVGMDGKIIEVVNE